jgi:hypothetical protein
MPDDVAELTGGKASILLTESAKTLTTATR